MNNKFNIGSIIRRINDTDNDEHNYWIIVGVDNMFYYMNPLRAIQHYPPVSVLIQNVDDYWCCC
jgi:hypothetical protein